MTCYIALLRAVNVGGTGQLPMADLKRLCAQIGLAAVRTYIASGNVVFTSALTEAGVRAALAQALQAQMSKAVGVQVRSAAELAEVLAGNPFPGAEKSRTMAVFLDRSPPAGMIEGATGVHDEQMVAGQRVLYIHYPSGMGRSKLRLKGAEAGTARNMNTVAKLVEMSSAADAP